MIKGLVRWGAVVFDALSELLIRSGLLATFAVEIKAENTQASLIKSPLYDIQCGRLLTYEKDRFALMDESTDEVGNGLAFPCAGRTVDNKMIPRLRTTYRLELAEIRRHDKGEFLGTNKVVQHASSQVSFVSVEPLSSVELQGRGSAF